MFVEEFQEDGHLRWHIDRPERANSLGPTIAKELNCLMKALQKKLAKPSAALKLGKPLSIQTLTISAQAIENSKEPTWIAGGDLKELAKLTEKKAARQYAKSLSDFCADLEKLPIPVIALIHGAAIGGGAEVALAADVRIASKASSFLFKQLKVGLMCGYGSSKRLIDLVGKARCQSLLYLGQRVSALEAYELGLIHSLADHPDLDSTYRRIRDDLGNLSPAAFAAQKAMFNLASDVSAKKVREAELDQFTSMWLNPAHRQFLSKK